MDHSKSRFIVYLSLFTFMLFSSIDLNAQTLIDKVVVSQEENIPLENAHVLSSDTVVFTRANGMFSVIFSDYIEVFHIGYESIRFDDFEDVPDTIRLIQKNNLLEEVTISAERAIKEIEKEPKFWIKDFEIIYDHLIVLKKTHFKGDTKLSLHDLEGKYLDEFDFKYKIKAIKLNCIGQLFIKYDFGYVLIYVSNGKLVEGPKYNRQKYDQIFGNCVLYRNKEWIYEFERFNGLERNIVSIKDQSDSLLKKISLPQLLQLKNNYRGEIAYGSNVSNITVTDEDVSRSIRNRQATSDFLDKVLLKANEKNSFALMDDGILIANAIFDSLHYYKQEVIEKQIDINKRDYIFNNTDKSRAFFFQRNGLKEYTLSEINENLDCQNLLLFEEHVNKIRVCGNKVFYLIRDNSRNSVKTRIYFENI